MFSNCCICFRKKERPSFSSPAVNVTVGQTRTENLHRSLTETNLSSMRSQTANRNTSIHIQSPLCEDTFENPLLRPQVSLSQVLSSSSLSDRIDFQRPASSSTEQSTRPERLPQKLSEILDYDLENDGGPRPNQRGLIVDTLRTGDRALTTLRSEDTYLPSRMQDEKEAYIDSGIIYLKMSKNPVKGPTALLNYILTGDGRLIVGKENHDQLAAGIPVACAGKMIIGSDNIIKVMNKNSGSYAPTSRQLIAAVQYLNKQNPNAFTENFKITHRL